MARGIAQRVFIIVVTLAFLITTVGVSVALIWQMVQENKEKTVQRIETLEKIDLKEGTGEEVKPGDTVTVDYVGSVAATGKVFQSSIEMGQPVSFPLDNVITGWKDGIPGMKVGGERRLKIPAAQAYGFNPPAGSGIPVDADLIFDVTLHKIGQ